MLLAIKFATQKKEFKKLNNQDQQDFSSSSSD
jgi:hypothetical protein